MSVLGTLTARYRVSSEPLRSERRLELLFLAAIALVLLQLLWLSLRWFTSVAVDPVAPARDSLAVMEPASPGVITTLQSQVFQARPLFWASRTPADGVMPMIVDVDVDVDVGDEAPGVAAPRLEKLQLTGVFGGGGSGGAIIAYQGNRMRILVDQELDGWTLTEVGPGRVVFVSGGVSDERLLNSAPVVAPQAVSEQRASASSPLPNTVRAAPAENQARGKKPAKTGQAPPAPAERSLSLGGR